MTIEAKTKILVIDDDPEIRYTLERVLSTKGYNIQAADSAEKGIPMIKTEKPHVVLMDIRMGGISGLEALQNLRKESQESMIILMTAFGTTQTAIEAMKFGAFDYITKPFDLAKLLDLVHHAASSSLDLRLENNRPQEPLLNSDDYREGIVGQSEAMQSVFKTIGQVATSDATIMITGESGTGKELIARCIYQHSHRHNETFSAVNCAAIPENLIESELFGHEKGSFTGANTQRIGTFEQCDGGTLFLDEVGDMPLQTQTKILRVIQEGEIQRVGGNQTIKVNVRLIAATNKNLESMVKESSFREDLFYRLNVVRIELPSLRERKNDIPELVDYMLQKLHKSKKIETCRIASDALQTLIQYDWPGNVRELENVVYRSAVIAQGDTILLKNLPNDIRQTASSTTNHAQSARESEPIPEDEPKENATASDSYAQLEHPRLSYEDAMEMAYKHLRSTNDKQMLQSIEKSIIQRALQEFKGNQVKTSQLLGITRTTLRKRIEQYELKA